MCSTQTSTVAEAFMEVQLHVNLQITRKHLRQRALQLIAMHTMIPQAFLLAQGQTMSSHFARQGQIHVHILLINFFHLSLQTIDRVFTFGEVIKFP